MDFNDFSKVMLIYTEVLQNCVAHQLKLVYEHGNFNLYTPELDVEVIDLWIGTLKDNDLISAVRIGISDECDLVHVPHRYTAKFPFRYFISLVSKINNKNSQIVQIQ